MCFAPQRRALFRHLNFQKWSEPGVLSTFWLRNVLRATTACTLSTSQLPKVIRKWCLVRFDFEMCFAPQRRALFRHLNFQKWSENGVLGIHFDLETCFAPRRRAIFHLSSGQLAPHPPLLRAYFSTFRRHKSLEKNTVFRDFPTFSRICIFFLLTLSLLLFSLLIFSLLSASALLCFSSVHIVGSLTSKLPSIMLDLRYLSKKIQIFSWLVHFSIDSKRFKY